MGFSEKVLVSIPLALHQCFDYRQTMKDGPAIARIASLIGDPARANMLTALLGGQALTATELAAQAGVTLPTASSHLARLQAAALIEVHKQGRHRYHQLAGADIAHLLETLMGVAAKGAGNRFQPGPQEPALRKARICYDHLAGDMGVRLFESLKSQKLMLEDGARPLLTDQGRRFCEDFGIDILPLERRRRPLCRSCLDWSVRRSHLAGSLGAALLSRLIALQWAHRQADGSRVIRFTPKGEQAFSTLFALKLEPLSHS